MWRIRKLAGQILTCKMQLLVQVSSPFRAIGHVINNTVVGDKFFGASLAGVAPQFHLGDDVIGDVHVANYTWMVGAKSRT